MEKVAGVVILFNPDSSIIENIKSYIDQVEELLLFDNSTKKSNLINELPSQNKIIYYSKHTNMGVGYALNYAAGYFVKKGYHYLLTMDQDSIATPNMVLNLLRSCKEINKVGIISPKHIGRFDPYPTNESIEEKLVVMTSGNILNLSVYTKVGSFADYFFIDYVDTEYCMRLNKNGFKVLTNNAVALYHNEANVSKRNFFVGVVFPYNHSAKRLYFKVRNRCYLRDKYKKDYPKYFSYEFPLFKNMLIKILLFEDDKVKKIHYALKGYFDYKKKVYYSPFDK